jgi:hypothetical protein
MHPVNVDVVGDGLGAGLVVDGDGVGVVVLVVGLGRGLAVGLGVHVGLGVAVGLVVGLVVGSGVSPDPNSVTQSSNHARARWVRFAVPAACRSTHHWPS